MKKTIKKVAVVTAIAAMAFGFSGNSQANVPTKQEKAVAISKGDIVLYRPGVI